MSTGEFLRTLRLQRHLSQDELARKLDIPVNTYARYEMGIRSPSIEIAAKLCDFFGVSISELLSGEKKDESAFRMPSDYELQFALFGSSDISPEDFENVKAYARFLVQQRNNK